MAVSLDAAEGFRDAVFGFKNDACLDRTCVPALTRDTELVGVPVTGVCDDFEYHDLSQIECKSTLF